MIFDELPVALPWYNNIQKQDRFRENVANERCIYQLGPCNGLLPFQFRKEKTSEYPTSWRIICTEGNEVCNLDAFIHFLNVGSYAGSDYISVNDIDNETHHFITSTVPDGLPSGNYYMKMVFTTNVWVSEVWRVPLDRFDWQDTDTLNYPVVIWRNSSDIAPIKYSGSAKYTNFYNKLFLDTFIHASEPTIEITGEKDGFNELIPTFQKAVIKYDMNLMVPDYMKIALFLMQIHDNVTLVTERGLREGTIKNFDIKSTLEPDGNLSFIEISFEQQQLVTTIGCPQDMPEDTDEPGSVAPHLTVTWITEGVLLRFHIPTMPPGSYGVVYSNDMGTPTQLASHVSSGDLIAGINIPAGFATNYFVQIWTFTTQIGVTNVAFP